MVSPGRNILVEDFFSGYDLSTGKLPHVIHEDVNLKKWSVNLKYASVAEEKDQDKY